MSIEGSVLLKNANLVDVKSSTSYIASILIQSGIIAGVFRENSGIESVDQKNINTIDLTGKWIIPGLIDMHVHIKEGYAPLFVASGITTVRNTGGNVLELRKLREESPTAPTPRVFSADRIIDGPPGLFGETSPWSINIDIDNPELARLEVRRQIETGADLIKVYGYLSEEIMKVVVEEAKKHGKEVSCDLIHSSTVNAVQAANMGVKWNEHASGIIQSMYPGWHTRAEEHILNEVNWEEPDFGLIRDVCEQLVKHNVIICPTMVLFDQMNRIPDVWMVNNLVTKKTYENQALIQR